MMKRVFLVTLACMVLVAAFGFAEGRQEVRPAVEAIGEPQYGGRLTVIWSPAAQQMDPPTPDRMASATSAPHFWRQGFQEMPMIGDFLTYGPRGTNEFAYQLRGYIPEQYMKGWLLDRWEIDSEKIVWHVRRGIYWHGNRPHVMQSRELVADDLVEYVNLRRRDPAGSYIRQAINDARVIDRYTLEIPFAKGFDFVVNYLLTYEDRAEVEPPETLAAGPDRWENHVGTGAFMNTEYVVGSHMRFERNPDYWDTTVIDGKEYQLPFADELYFPIIPEEASQIAALRTGRVDWMGQVPAPHWSVLDARTPDLKSERVIQANGYVLTPRVDKAPFDNINVRHALMIGTDMHAFNAMLGVGIDLPIDWHPAYPGDPSVYVPKEELPPESRGLYNYDPAKARQMLREAGVPEGFRMEVVTHHAVMAQQRASLLASQWEKLGIRVDINVSDETTYVGYRYNKNFKDALINVVETASPIFLLQRTAYTDATLNPGHYSDPDMDARISEIVSELDVDRQTRLTKDACLKLLYDAPYIPLQATVDGFFWWPWLRNYYGEFNHGDANQPFAFFNHMWIDRDMKRSMGY